MNTYIKSICDAIKHALRELNPIDKPMSFTVLTGREKQGKTTLLKHSDLNELMVSEDPDSFIYYNSKGIILELDEQWLKENSEHLKQFVKQIHKSSRPLKISALILCLDLEDLLGSELQLDNRYHETHGQLLKTITQSLGYSTDTFILFTKLDKLAGFTEFYQSEHDSDLEKPLGFSLPKAMTGKKVSEVFNKKFSQMIEVLGQQVITKLHPSRSTLKRTLIREFPLQILSLRHALLSLLHNIGKKNIPIKAIYFSSAEQGGTSLDRLNKKIQHEYSLTVRDTFSQATNFRPYFIQGAINSILQQSGQIRTAMKTSHKNLVLTLSGIAAILLVYIGFCHLKTSQVLDEASKELITFESKMTHEEDKTSALYHLTKAKEKMNAVSAHVLTLPALFQLKNDLNKSTQQQLQEHFIPYIKKEIEIVLLNSKQSPTKHFHALKAYLMLDEKKHFSESYLMNWFQNHWKSSNKKNIKQKIKLLKDTFHSKNIVINIDNNIVASTRSYLNSLPSNYLYYSIAKEQFPKEKEAIDIKGFDLASQSLPVYYTRSKFPEIIQTINQYSSSIKSDSWVLDKETPENLTEMLAQAYSYDYKSWWKAFIKHSRPQHFNNYNQAKTIFQSIHQSGALIKLVQLIKLQTNPMHKDGNQVFNQYVSQEFTDLNLVNQRSLTSLNQVIGDMEKFMETFSLIQDSGKTAFKITKRRFNQPNSYGPISQLYQHSSQMPEAISTWTEQLADDSWSLLISDSKIYINQQWQDNVYKFYKARISHRYPIDKNNNSEIQLSDFNSFFSRQGIMNNFISQYIKPFLDTQSAQWKPKVVNGYQLPLSNEMLTEIMRANIISNMFFSLGTDKPKIEFSLEKIDIDPIVSHLNIVIGHNQVDDNQDSHSYMHFVWPQPGAKLSLDSIDGKHYELSESGNWALFRLLDKVNVYNDDNDTRSLQILFEINSNSGRYLLKTANPVNPFTPGVLNGFDLKEVIV